MKISIITVCYNSADTIEQTIQSVISQNYSDFEYIIVDGLSTDGTLEILKKYESKIKYISEKDSGIYNAMNKGIALATGEIIGIIGSDDYYEDPNILQYVADAFEISKADTIYGDAKIVDGKNTEKLIRFWKGGDYNVSQWLHGWMPPHLAFYVKKDVYNKFGVFREDLICSADYELMLRHLYKYKSSSFYTPKTLITMRTGGMSNASFKHRLKANQEDRMAWKINDVKPKWYTLYLKPISKIKQFFST